MIRRRIGLAIARLALAAVFVLTAWLLMRLRMKLGVLQSRAVESGWRLCTNCGYSLVGVTCEDGDCPECGKPYRLDEVREAWQAARFRSP